MSFLGSILWEILKWTAILGGSFILPTFLILLFHPIYFTLKGRASVKGQRGEIIFSYLFNLLKIRFIATAKKQDILLEFCGLRKKIAEEGKKKGEEGLGREEEGLEKAAEPLSGEKPPVVEETPVEDEPIAIEESLATEESLNTAEFLTSEEPLPIEEPLTSEKSLVTEETPALEEPLVTNEPEAFAAEETIIEESVESIAKEAPQQTQGQKIREKLRKFKKDFNRRYDELRKKLRLIRQRWNSLFPVAKRFWNRGKKGFKFANAKLRMHYSLDEPYLTGMLCGYLSPTIGFAKYYGLEFEPVPVFSEEPAATIHTKASWCVIIRPWLLVWSVTCLLFEKNLYKELLWLYRNKKGAR